MEIISIVLLTSTNYFQSKSQIEDLLRSQMIYRKTLGKKTVLDDEKKIAKWDKKNDQAHGLIGMSISPNLRFHLDGLDSPVKDWDKLYIVIGIKNEI